MVEKREERLDESPETLADTLAGDPELLEQVTALVSKRSKLPRSLKIAEVGVRTGRDFAKLMSALMSDIIEGRVTPNVGNATCNAGGKLLKVVEMQYKYGTDGPGTGEKVLRLTDSVD
jgi:hypothetical protein